MECRVSHISILLHNLKKAVSTENAFSMLMTLNEVISSKREEMEFLYNEEGFNIIMDFMTSNKNLEGVCLKIFIYASKKHAKVREKLLENNILHRLGDQLKKETNYFKKNILLYCALIVVLVKGNRKAQIEMQSSGCLSGLTGILGNILDDESEIMPWRNMELIIYAITVCIKYPRHPENQTRVGWMVLKILVFLEKQSLYIAGDHLQLVKCIWSFLKSVIDRNEVNQQIFMNYSGTALLFRWMQEILEEKKWDEMAELLSKMTAILMKLTFQKEFLCQASNYCSVVILCGLLKTSNIWVLQHIITFLHSLTQELPYILRSIEDKEILRGMIRAKTVLTRCELTSKLCYEIWDHSGISQEIESDLSNENQSIILPISSGDESIQNLSPFCSLHDSESLEDLRHSSYIPNYPVEMEQLNFRRPKRLSDGFFKFYEEENKESKKLGIRENGLLKSKIKSRFRFMRKIGGNFLGGLKKYWYFLIGRIFTERGIHVKF